MRKVCQLIYILYFLIFIEKDSLGEVGGALALLNNGRSCVTSKGFHGISRTFRAHSVILRTRVL